MAAIKKLMLLTLVLCSTLTGCGHKAAAAVKSHLTPSPPFNFSKYLSFTPKLPTYTDGYKFSSSLINRTIDPKHGNVIFYMATYGPPRGNCIKVEEFPANAFHVGNIPTRLRAVVKHGNVVYVVWAQGYAASRSQLRKVANSIQLQATAKPDGINISYAGVSSQKHAGFKVLPPGTFLVPPRAHLKNQSSDVTIQGTKKVLSYSMTYAHTVEIDEIKRLGNWNTSKGNSFDGKSRTIDGLTVDFDKPSVGGWINAAAFTNPASGIEFVIQNNGTSANEFQKIVSSVVYASVNMKP